ncbi:sigma-54 dependent transcriptional regulator [Mucilaginibacter rubeus]|uniref:Response regulator n=1 Tax=Mucilaginibacter rubeus TaxID=2027860 RepID=A0A5C1I0N7_9SPHI|nr:sigma 54-interacting transcriptional regulator [Mucilaginibacter rubeus]QEM11737.1 response regulator [Mucilaginibacter rubeus]
MKENLLIVEDEFIVANDLRLMLESAGYHVCGIAASVDAAKQAVDKFKPTWVLLDIFLQDDSVGTDLAPYLQEKNIGFIYISANQNQSILEIAKATQPYGFLVKPFKERDLLMMLDIARGKHESNVQFAHQREYALKNQLRVLVESNFDYEQLLEKVPAIFQSVLPFDLMRFEWFPDGQEKPSGCGFIRIAYDEYQLLPAQGAPFSPIFDKAAGPAQQSIIYNELDFSEYIESEAVFAALGAKYGLESFLRFGTKNTAGRLLMGFFSKKADPYNYAHLNTLERNDTLILQLFQMVVKQGLLADQPSLRRANRVQVEHEPKANTKFDGIYGSSPALLQVLDNIEMVAATPVSVLILGESGTGKEMVAHNIHYLSSRKDKPFITVNCAALPAELIESELFGHEKGAFTGAVEKRLGKFEMAEGGTIFLDEIGEMPVESQVKLLRMLQEKEFEHIGGSKTIKVNVRVIAATNRNLEKEVSEGRFRLDLFYRLNVFPIELPPLRERPEDILILAQHFLAKSSKMMGRGQVPVLSKQAAQQLMAYNWPGNIRELQHLMERTVIRSKDDVIQSVAVPAMAPVTATESSASATQKTLEQIEAEHILKVLKSCKGKVFGLGGAAEILGLPPSTLTSRMKKLGIKKESYHER